MVIRKQTELYKSGIFFVLLSAIFLPLLYCPVVACGTQAENDKLILRLQEKLAGCRDSNMVGELKYRLGTLYFKAGQMKQADKLFLETLQDGNCPEIVSFFAFNMSGQTKAAVGDYKEALHKFEQVSRLGERLPDSEGTIEKIRCLAILGRAAIYEELSDCDSALKEYGRSIATFSEVATKPQLQPYLESAYDRILELNFASADVEAYLRTAGEIEAGASWYGKMPLLKLEDECIRYAKKTGLKIDFSQGPASLPVQIIEQANDVNDNSLTEIFEKIYRQYSASKYNDLIAYHYACLLEKIGDYDKALELFGQVVNPSGEKTTAKLSAVEQFAAIKIAILLNEKQDYSEALKSLSIFSKQSDSNCISELAGRVRVAIEQERKELSGHEKK